jgi:preprotein translocase subunit SecA
MIDDVNKEVISFLFKGNLPSQNPSDIHEAKQVRQKQNYTESKQDVASSDAASEARRAGEAASQRPSVTETITRETPKINRNDTVTIKHVMSGKSETMKFKKAESMIASGEWVIVNE